MKKILSKFLVPASCLITQIASADPVSLLCEKTNPYSNSAIFQVILNAANTHGKGEVVQGVPGIIWEFSLACKPIDKNKYTCKNAGSNKDYTTIKFNGTTRHATLEIATTGYIKANEIYNCKF